MVEIKYKIGDVLILLHDVSWHNNSDRGKFYPYEKGDKFIVFEITASHIYIEHLTLNTLTCLRLDKCEKHLRTESEIRKLKLDKLKKCV